MMPRSTISLPTITAPVRPAEFFELRPAVMVVSHHRSGTHFLMNALANCYDYVGSPWINLDHDTANINFYHAPSVGDYLMKLAERPVATIVKSHHPAEFLAGELERIGRRWVIFVPVRHPVDTLLSFWRFLNTLTWFEGPQVNDAAEFFRAEPCGAIMRYQQRQFANMMLRWANAVESWLNAAKASPCVVIVRYEELYSDFERVMRGFAPSLGREPARIARPERETSEWLRAKPDAANKPPDREALRGLCRKTIGRTMDLLNYD